MKKYLLSLCLAILLLTSCKDDEGLPLTPDLVIEIRVFDLDNNGNSSDIRVDFEVRDNINVFEYRVMVIPSNTSSSFTVSLAAALPESNYLEVNPVPFETEYSIKRLPSSFLDVNGNQIINETEYVVAVLIFGTGNHQLSGFSKPLTVKDQPIYNGLYFIGFEENWSSLTTNQTSQFNIFADGVNFVDISWNGVQYIGTRICDPNIVSNDRCLLYADRVVTEWRIYSFTIEQNVVTNFTWDWPSQPCWVESLCTSGLGSPCPFLAEGGGTVDDDLAIKVNLVGEDCIAGMTSTVSLFRQ